MNGNTISQRLAVWLVIAGLAGGTSVAHCKKGSSEVGGSAGTENATDVATPPTLQAAAAAAIAAQPPPPAPPPAAPPALAAPVAPAVAPVVSAPLVAERDDPILSPRQQIEALAAQLKGAGEGIPTALAGLAGTPAAGSPPGGASTGPGPCDAYVDKFMVCQGPASAGMNDPEIVRMMQDAVRDGCDAMRSLGDAALSAALAACANEPCGEAGVDWLTCVGTKMAEGATGGPAAPPEATPPVGPESPVTTGAAEEDVPPVCLAYADKMLDCVMGEAGMAGLPPDVMRESRDAMLDACAAMRDAGPQVTAAFEQAVTDCAQTPCGEAGAEWTQCITDTITRVMFGQP